MVNKKFTKASSRLGQGWSSGNNERRSGGPSDVQTQCRH